MWQQMNTIEMTVMVNCNHSQMKLGDGRTFFGMLWFECESPSLVPPDFFDENTSVLEL